MGDGYRAAVRAFRDDPGNRDWAALPAFADGVAGQVADRVDAKVSAGALVLPSPVHLLAALRHTPANGVRAVILGQDPYPTPGDAHGLSFSVLPGRAVPRSLANVFREYVADLGQPMPMSGSLLAWANAGVLLLNTCLTVEAGKAGSHRGLGWECVTDAVIAAVSEGPTPVVFLLWGKDAERKRDVIDESRHLVLASPHPSPLSARRGFFGSRPFSTANTWLMSRTLPPIDWHLPALSDQNFNSESAFSE
jgi:uracil-DNA glycosylase